MKCGLSNCIGALSLILVIKIYVCSNSNLEGLEGSVAQTIVEEEGAPGSQR